MSETWTLTLEERGLAEFMKVLKAEQPKALATLRKHLRLVGEQLAADATMRFPNGGSYGVKINKRGVIVGATGGGARSSGNDWSNRGVLTAVLESFGAKQPGSTPQAQSVTATLNSRYGTPGRFLNAAWKEGKSGYRKQAAIAAAEAERALQEHLNAAGCGE